MMKTLVWPLTAMLLMTGCISVDSNDSVTNELGETVSTETLTLNGLWDGQFDQDGDLRVLMYQGTVFAIDDSQGYYGSIELENSTQIATLSLTAWAISASDDTAGHYLADGTSLTYDLEGLVYTTSSTDDTLVGDYENDSSAGSFYLTDDGTWSNNSSTSLVAGEWTAGDYSLYVTSLGSNASIRAISSATGGCTFDGYLTPTDSDYNLYTVLITERKNCTDYNAVNVAGYATITTDGELEFFIHDTGLIYYMIFTAATSDTTTE